MRILSGLTRRSLEGRDMSTGQFEAIVDHVTRCLHNGVAPKMPNQGGCDHDGADTALHP